ncbi:Uncharacterized protein TCM_004208 [Theobroma cacao]|uniref:Uncharacterized protein n=1 Tax=Theobroma cacao TaxID=3641 RepID=A0A061DPE0_THECC|nr:Uncharacterized protein TCM_004208 [Theobroma cacao]
MICFSWQRRVPGVLFLVRVGKGSWDLGLAHSETLVGSSDQDVSERDGVVGSGGPCFGCLGRHPCVPFGAWEVNGSPCFNGPLSPFVPPEALCGFLGRLSRKGMEQQRLGSVDCIRAVPLTFLIRSGSNLL